MGRPKLYASIEDWLIAKATVDGVGCWVPAGDLNTDPGGYPLAWFNGMTRKVMIIVWNELVGPLPKGIQRDHRCKNKQCFNPDHLEPVSAWENNSRGGSPTANNLRKTHCSKGHPFNAENTVHRKTGGRRCRICMKTNYRSA